MATRTVRKTTRKTTKRTAKRPARKAAKRSASKKTTRRKVTKAAAPKAKIASASGKVRSKSDVCATIADNVGISKKEVANVFDVMGQIIGKDIGRGGPGAFNIPGLMKVTVKRKPATKARKGINPFTGEEMMFKAKPARNVVKVRPLKALKEMV